MPDLPALPDPQTVGPLVVYALLAAGVALAGLAVAYVAKVLGQWWKWRRSTEAAKMGRL
jgi:hypothetical protein